MTIITKPISEKKTDKLDQPLVVSIHTEYPCGNGDYPSAPEASPGAGGDANLFVARTCYTRTRRASSATTVCLFLTALMVMSFGVLSGIYLYRQFALAQMHRYRGRCRIPFEEVTNSAMFQQEDTKSLNTLNMLQKMSAAFANRFESQNQNLEDGKYFEESYIMDDNHEKLTTSFQGGKHNSFIYDFSSNETAIIDQDSKRCFVMPLDRAHVLPPKNLNDLLIKMRTGYYELDFSILRQSMRVVTPAISNRSRLGMYIQRDCTMFPIFKLEKIEESKVEKRNAEIEDNVFTVFNGQTTQFHIVNLHELDDYEQNVKGAQS
ncbi:integral membrane protein 2B [Nilaparvata lugens]|uniref:integral membrane protein 2B n=1 Tax=Nilaparvata lugens TaxID=108931 RepID=UPI000B98553A|nr:integral membrane protein 2B [Nilaparvata lugens]